MNPEQLAKLKKAELDEYVRLNAPVIPAGVNKNQDSFTKDQLVQAANEIMQQSGFANPSPTEMKISTQIPSAKPTLLSEVTSARGLEPEFQDIRASVDGTETTARKRVLPIKEQLERIVPQARSEDVIHALANKFGRSIPDFEIKQVLDYLHRKSIPYYVHTDDIVRDAEKDKDFMPVLKKALEQLPTVKVTVIDDNYPESATIVLKVDNNALDEAEAETLVDRINDTIYRYKPKTLEKLEVIYHNKEVY